MKFRIEDKLLNYLSEEGREDVTLDLKEIPSNGSMGRLPEMKISLQGPANSEEYRPFDVCGRHIHLSKLLRTGDTLKLFLSGLGPFKKVEASGINLVL